MLAIFSHVRQLRNCQEEGNSVILDAVIAFLYLGGKVFRQALQNYLGMGKRWVWPIKVQAGETRVWETQGHKNFTSLDGTMFLSVSFIIYSKVLKKKKKPLKLLVILPPRHTGYKGFGICYFLPVFYTQTDVAGFLFDFYTQDYIWSTFPCHGILSERMNFSGYIILLHMRYVRIHLTISFLLTCEWHSIFNDE